MRSVVALQSLHSEKTQRDATQCELRQEGRSRFRRVVGLQSYPFNCFTRREVHKLTICSVLWNCFAKRRTCVALFCWSIYIGGRNADEIPLSSWSTFVLSERKASSVSSGDARGVVSVFVSSETDGIVTESIL